MSALAAILLPLTLMLLFPAPDRFRRIAIGLTPWSGILLVWPLLDQPSVSFSWPLVGVTLGVDSVNQPLILLTALAWNLSAWFAWNTIERDRRWFWSGWLGALAGMSLLLLAGDIASFYVGYALLSLSAYLLITHEHNAQAWRAARVYLIMAFAGEAAILTGILLLAGSIGNAEFSTLGEHGAILLDSPARWFLLAGFAVKMGIMPLHVWLPLAHPVAPVPASAILSGVIVKAGLLGWLRFVPGFQEDPAWIGWLLMTFGLSTAFVGVIIGLFQQRIKTVLAYSTVSQMGLILTAFSLTFLAPEARPALITIIGLMALHHGLNKTALFLACGSALTIGRPARLLFVLPALSLAAFPLTSGYLAKNALKDALPSAVHEPLMTSILALTSTATALLMWRAWRLATGMKTRNPTLQPAWMLIVTAGLLVPWAWAGMQGLAGWPKGYLLWSATWPLLLALLLITIRHQLRWQPKIQIPEGDLVVWIERLVARLPGLTAPGHKDRHRPSLILRRWRRQQGWYEKQQRTIQATGLASLLLIGLIWLLFWI
ncbi:MAG: NADH/ubiquinone/plastoquinone (complex I) [Wenzhouxiangella sp.]|nr:MAG: NADH/ubiquinone/plastoquinone (complex I) [Wenzhouxiangella sp.]